MSTSKNILRLDYVEFATRDIALTKGFLATAFGWKFTDYDPEYSSFEDGRMTGGLYTSNETPAKTNPLIVIFAANLEEAAARVVRAGGEILKPAFDFPGGRRFHFADPTGLELAVWSDVRADGLKIG